MQQLSALNIDQVAQALGVSNSYINDQISQNKLKTTLLGSEYVVEIADFVAYQEKIQYERLQALNELAREAQELGLGY